jgi:hypothetical protein
MMQRCGLDSFHSEQAAVAGFCKHGNGLRVTEKSAREFLDEVSNY